MKELEVEWSRELNKSVLRVKVPGIYQENYQIRMLQENNIHGLVSMKAKGIGGKSLYEYDITDLKSLANYYKEKKITREGMQDFLIQIQQIMEEAKEYLLDVNQICLDPEYMFLQGNQVRFCYCPWAKDEIKVAFHKLMDEFVQWTDYQDTVSVKTAFLLHKETMEEDYNLSSLMRKIQELPEQDNLKNEKKRKSEILWKNEAYDTTEHDWIASQKQGSHILKETDNLWSPIKNFLHKHKGPKWGDWDGIYIEEEELY